MEKDAFSKDYLDLLEIHSSDNTTQENIKTRNNPK